MIPSQRGIAELEADIRAPSCGRDRALRAILDRCGIGWVLSPIRGSALQRHAGLITRNRRGWFDNVDGPLWPMVREDWRTPSSRRLR